MGYILQGLKHDDSETGYNRNETLAQNRMYGEYNGPFISASDSWPRGYKTQLSMKIIQLINTEIE